MLVVRSVREDDVDSLHDLIQESELGLTTLTISKEELADRIEAAIYSFGQKKAKPAGQPYVFVMEDQSSGQIVGTCAIYAKVGGYEPFYSYEIRTSIHASDELNVRKEIKALHLLEEHDGPSEIGSLFLSPKYWGQGHGRLLSMSRFLFVAAFPERFETEIIAEMRGVVDETGTSPLWSALGAHFFQIGFPKADTMTSKSKKFIADLMPKHPIYIPLLPEDAQNAVGQVHKNTVPARSVLEKEGFAFRDRVDIFDGGPTLQCATQEIRAIRESCQGVIEAIVANVKNGSRQLISNDHLNFRACMGDIIWNADGQASIDQVTALQLNLKVGDNVRSVPLKPN